MRSVQVLALIVCLSHANGYSPGDKNFFDRESNDVLESNQDFDNQLQWRDGKQKPI